MKIEVRQSLIANQSVQALMKTNYSIGSIITCEFLTRGLNDTYVVKTHDNQYIFRVYRKGWREKSDILFELDAINHLAEKGIPVSKPIKRIDNNWLTEILAPEGTRYGVLFTFSKGERPEITKDNCTLIGNALGKIHKASNSFNTYHQRGFELDETHLMNEPLSLISPHLNEDQNKFIKEITKNFEFQNLEFGFCHGDFHNFNMHLEGQKIEAFDFDCCGMGYRAYDLAVFWWNLKQNYPAQEPECWDAFINGYLVEKNMEDLKVLKKFVTLRRIWFMGTLLKK